MSVNATSTGTTQRTVRGRYAKFTGSMDVLLLEALRTHNPFTAKHGTRLQMWQRIAEIVGEELFKNPDVYSWHTCRDRVTALMKMYVDGKHDKLFKHGTTEENARKEAILREINTTVGRHTGKSVSRVALSILDGANNNAGSTKERKQPASKRRKVAGHNTTAAALAAAANAAVSGSGAASTTTAVAVASSLRGATNLNNILLEGATGSTTSPTLLTSLGGATTPSGHPSGSPTNSSLRFDTASGGATVLLNTALGATGGVASGTVGTAPDTLHLGQPESHPHNATSSGTASADHFRQRVMELIESKLQFDMDQRIKENELREQEFELQKRFLEYLQSK